MSVEGAIGLMFQFGILLITLLAYLDKKNNCLIFGWVAVTFNVNL